jgi:hypothetical protein
MPEKLTQYITIILAVVIIIAVGVIIYTNLPEETNNENDDLKETPDIPILIVLYDGEEKEYTLQQLTELDTMSGYGGYRTSYPSIKGQGTYTGVLVTSLVEDIAGPINNYSIKVVANEEGEIENQTYNYTTINGNVDIYNASNASEIIDIGGVNMILCYQVDGKPLNSSKDSNIKIAFINPSEEKITPAFLWWKFVESIEIIP